MADDLETRLANLHVALSSASKSYDAEAPLDARNHITTLEARVRELADRLVDQSDEPWPSGSEDAIILADAIVRAWERSRIEFDETHQVQLAIVAARFLVRIANSKERFHVAAECPEDER